MRVLAADMQGDDSDNPVKITPWGEPSPQAISQLIQPQPQVNNQPSQPVMAGTVNPEISQDISPFGIEQRLGAALMGIFLMCFGMPFILVPVMVLPNAFSLSDNLFFTVFIFCFTIPFFIAGLAVQYAGFKALRVALFPNSQKALEAFGKWNSGWQHKASYSVKNELNYLSSESLAQQRVAKSHSELGATAPQETAKQSTRFWDNNELESP